MGISSFNRITVDTEALEHNYRLISSRVADHVTVMAMVKSEAYGHGLITAAQAFARAGCSSFGVAELGEGVELRESGCEGDIFILLGFDHGNIDYFFSHDLTPVLFTEEDLLLIGSAAERKKKKIAIFLKFDCGMGRLGFAPSDAAELVRRLQDMEYVRLAGVMSHFPCADDRHSGNTREVFQLFSRTANTVSGNHILVSSICNSGGTLYHPGTHGDMVRIGISLYGYYPDGSQGQPSSEEQILRPAMTFSTRILQVKDVAAGSGISYGHIYITDRQTRLAVLPVGYSDGYLRNLSTRAEVLINGQRVPIRGRICMNLCLADITEIEGVQPGDEAVLLGRQGNESIDADEIGGWCDTISYEILCAFGNNNER